MHFPHLHVCSCLPLKNTFIDAIKDLTICLKVPSELVSKDESAKIKFFAKHDSCVFMGAVFCLSLKTLLTHFSWRSHGKTPKSERIVYPLIVWPWTVLQGLKRATTKSEPFAAQTFRLLFVIFQKVRSSLNKNVCWLQIKGWDSSLLVRKLGTGQLQSFCVGTIQMLCCWFEANWVNRFLNEALK